MILFQQSLSPISIKSLEIKNRYVLSPMETKQANPDGSVSDQIVEYYRRRAEGGVGLIIVEASYVHPTGKGFKTQLAIDRDELIEGLARIPQHLHPYGTKVALQLIHHGRQTESKVLGGLQPVAPSPIPIIYGEVPRALEEEEIEELIQSFAEACRRAKMAGFDAAEIHSAHGYLIHTFLSPHSNQRTDRYGGDLNGRMRFALEIIRRCREMVGPDFPLLTRVSHREDHKGGYEVDYMEQVVPHLVSAGIDILDVSVGNYNSIQGIGIAVADLPMGLNVEGAGRLKNAAGIPTIAVGRLNDPELAEQVIIKGQADMIALGRQLLADPDYVNKVIKGNLKEIRYCQACNDGCLIRMMTEDRVSCSINPECAREIEYKKKMTPVKTPKRIGVIGGGPAGLSAAYYCRLRGNQVILWEKTENLGGQWIAASKPRNKNHMIRLIDFYRTQLAKLGVEVNLRREANEKILSTANLDFVILSSGARPYDLAIPHDGTVPIIQAVDVLLGKVDPGQNLVIVGASYTGMEVADLLLDGRKSITIIEALDKSPLLLNDPRGLDQHGRLLFRRLKKADVPIVLNAPLAKVERGNVFYGSDKEMNELKSIDTLILAIGSKPEDSLKRQLYDLKIPFKIIGDATKPRNLHSAVYEGYFVSTMI